MAEPAAFYSAAPGFKTDVKVGPQLSRFFEPVMKWKKRECFAALHDYIYGENNDRVLILYGLRPTFIPYREFESVLGVAGIDRFIEYGGTMSMGGSNYNTDKFTFATKKSADTEFRYGEILSRNVIYRGPAGAFEGINYLNVEEYLKGLA